MPSVIAAFARAMATTAGLTMTSEGKLVSADGAVRYVLRTEDDRIPDTAHFDLLTWIRSWYPDETGLVFAYAQKIKPDDLGVLGLAVKTAPTLRNTLQLIERYFRLVTDTAVYCLETDGPLAVFSIAGQTSPQPILHLRNECALAGFAHNLLSQIGPRLQFEAVTFRHPCRGEAERYAAFFGCPVHFGAAKDAIVMRRPMLDLPNRLGDKGVCSFLTDHLDTEIDALPAGSALTRDLLNRLSKTLSSGVPSAAAIAQDLGMSERTLYRRLAEEGLTYRDMLREAQTKLARELLAGSSCSIAEIAFLTGFSEQSTFTRAFKRWVGQPPAQFRQQSATA
ncbi:AraC family transcriptional regulator [Stappia sp. BW2]|uniref:AraC family transcriptional regulator n=1 Tax=Stappia sp. BW2 TaxID=2592622 RepID=UPI0011DE821D|nr:AraC family transcriptional regulator [Stappia sp. BW2]TYC65073.1 AraC family transcriptional regulator [Stappia sp. BW2]